METNTATPEVFDYSALTAAVDDALNETGDAPPEGEDAPESDEKADEGAQTDASEADADDGGAPELDPEEARARESGWRPKDDYSGDPDEWVDAAEYNRRRPLYDRISKQKKELKDVKKTLDSVVKYQKELEAKTRAKVIAEFEAKKREAVKFGDLEAFEAAEAEIKKVSEEKGIDVDLPGQEEEPEQPEAKQLEIPQFVLDFEKANPWFNTDTDMQEVMLARTQRLTAEGKPLQEAMTAALAHVKNLFPDKFSNPNKTKPSPVMGGRREQRPAAKSIANLTPEQREVWRYYKSRGIMTEQKFLETLED